MDERPQCWCVYVDRDGRQHRIALNEAPWDVPDGWTFVGYETNQPLVAMLYGSTPAVSPEAKRDFTEFAAGPPAKPLP